LQRRWTAREIEQLGAPGFVDRGRFGFHDLWKVAVRAHHRIESSVGVAVARERILKEMAVAAGDAFALVALQSGGGGVKRIRFRRWWSHGEEYYLFDLDLEFDLEFELVVYSDL
jgi:hypothetical protein